MKRSAGGLVERYGSSIEGVLGCYDRMIIGGTLVRIASESGAQAWLYEKGVRCFDLGQVAEPLRDLVRANAEKVATEAGVKIEYIERKNFRKEERIAALLKERGRHPGLVHVFSAMENCYTFKPRHDKESGQSRLRYRAGRCLHYYFYLIDEELGLCFVRVPTWLPFRLEVYFNQHQWLANQLRREGIDFELGDNVFYQIEDWERAQELVDGFAIKRLHGKLCALGRRFCPAGGQIGGGYHWSLRQVEYALDVVFKKESQLRAIYEEISRQAILTVRAGEVARFLGKKLSQKAEIESHFHTRVEGTRVRHALGRNALKMYDKDGRVLRIECVSNEVSFFKHYRKVVHRDGAADYQVAPLKKSIYSLGDLRQLMRAATERYLRFVGELEDRTWGRIDLAKISAPVRDGGDRSWRGFNFFRVADAEVLLALLRGEYQLSGLSNRLLQKRLPGRSPSQISRILKRLRLHGLLRKIGGTYKYYLTRLGQRALITAIKLKEHLILPLLNPTLAPTTS
jgi:hypothetical protein